jgi:hypothetical protein
VTRGFTFEFRKKKLIVVDVVIYCGFDIGMSDTVLWEWGLQWISVISGLYKVVVVIQLYWMKVGKN